MAEKFVNPDSGFLQEIAALRRDVDTLMRMPSGLMSIGPPHLATVPAARVERGTAFAVANSTSTPMQWDSEIRDNYNIFDSGSNTRLTAPIPGVYLAELGIQWISNATGYRYAIISLNGVVVSGETKNAANGPDTYHAIAATQTMTTGQYIEATVIQTSGGSLNVAGTPGSYMSLTWLGNS